MKTALTPNQVTGKHQGHLIQCQCRQLQPQAMQAFIALQKAAKKDGFEARIASGFRDFSRQLWIWNSKFDGKRPILDAKSQPMDTRSLSDLEKIHAILRWSALPGSSRHHWGSDLDIYCVKSLPENTPLQLEPWEYQKGGHQFAFAEWLEANRTQWHFDLPFATDTLEGVGFEPWHLSHQLSAERASTTFNEEVLYQALHNSDISGKAALLENLPTLFKRYLSA